MWGRHLAVAEKEGDQNSVLVNKCLILLTLFWFTHSAIAGVFEEGVLPVKPIIAGKSQSSAAAFSVWRAWR